MPLFSSVIARVFSTFFVVSLDTSTNCGRLLFLFEVGDPKPYEMLLVLVPQSAGSVIQATVGKPVSIVEKSESRFLLNCICTFSLFGSINI